MSISYCPECEVVVEGFQEHDEEGNLICPYCGSELTELYED